MSIPRSEWEFYGNAGHYICGQWCRFHIATKVGPWLVSTVGEYVPPFASGGSERTEREWLSKNFPGEDIGYNRKYETMVFPAGNPCPCGCGMPMIDGDELATNGYNTAAEATAGHFELCNEFSEKENAE